jgi:hypothetical protein
MHNGGRGGVMRRERKEKRRERREREEEMLLAFFLQTHSVCQESITATGRGNPLHCLPKLIPLAHTRKK